MKTAEEGNLPTSTDSPRRVTFCPVRRIRLIEPRIKASTSGGKKPLL